MSWSGDTVAAGAKPKSRKKADSQNLAVVATTPGAPNPLDATADTADTANTADAINPNGNQSGPLQPPINLDKERATRRWKAMLKTKGTAAIIKPILFNVLCPLRHAWEFQNTFFYNSFSHVVEVRKPLPWSKESESAWKLRLWTDHDDLMLTEWLQDHGRMDISTKTASDGVFAVAKENEFHPVRDYFDRLKWDGVKRLDNWLINYLGVDETEYAKMVGPKYLISAVARIMKPGCKADCMLILIGDQGQGKSTACERLAGKDWFTDQIGSVSGGKDTSIAMSGKMVVEFSDLECFHGRTADELKAFLSRTTDRYRAPFGRYAADYPRQVVFIGTTNQRTPLKDFTGNRRFWPVHTGKTDVSGIERDRDQIWAEAMERYKAGSAWWLDTPEARSLADAVVEESREIDEWEQIIAKFIRGLTQVRVIDILDQAFDKLPKDTTKSDQMRVGSCLTALRWERVRTRIDSVRQYVYMPKELVKQHLSADKTESTTS